MHTTDNYQLSQWESADRILMESFNGDNQKIDAALKASADAIAAKADADTLRYVKICETEAQAQTGQIDLDVSGVDWTQYLKVDLFVHAPEFTGSYSIQVNHIDTGYYSAQCNGGGSNSELYTKSSMATITGAGGGWFQLYPPHPLGNVRAIYWTLSVMGNVVGYNGYQTWAPCTWESLESFNISGTNLPAGTKVSLCGVRA